MLEEKYGDDVGLKVDVDCLVRKDNEAIVGGVVKETNDKHPVGKGSGRRAYVKLVDDGDHGGDYISKVLFDDGIKSSCAGYDESAKFVVDYDNNVKDAPRVSICSKHGDWEKCLEKGKAEQIVKETE